MRNIVKSGQFKKDYKRYRYNLPKLKVLFRILSYLKEGKEIPPIHKPHKLHGFYEGCMECRVENDFLLIWIDETTNTVRLLRLGTHHELFGL